MKAPESKHPQEIVPHDAAATVDRPSNGDACSMSWVLWGSSAPDDLAAIHHEVDQIFSNFSFYPEADWPHYRFKPPEGPRIVGAWRHPEGIAYVFLMNNPGMTTASGIKQLVLSYDGERSTLAPLLPQIKKLKRELARKHGQKNSEQRLILRLGKADTSASLKRLMALMAPITAIINALALYLHKLPRPTIETPWLASLYQFLLSSVFISALALLFAFTLICLLYTCKYGFLLLRRL
jgi:hypothetical protein